MTTVSEALGQALQHHRAGQLPQAEQLYRRILQADPRHADALHLLGVLISQAGRDDLAIDYIQQALAIKPHVAAFHNNLGFSLQALGRLEEAELHYREAIALDPNFSGAHNNLGNVHRAHGNTEAAARCYRQAVALAPDYAEAQNNLGVALQELGKLAEAEAYHRVALRLKPDSIDTLNNLGVSLQSQKKLEEALATFQQALRLKPDDAETHSNLGNVRKEQGKLDEAVGHYQEAVRLKPKYAVAHNNLGFALQEQGNYAVAMASYGRALEIEPDLAVAHWNRSLLRLLLGDFEQGWQEYEWRWTQPSFTRRSFPQPRWDGSDLNGKTLFLHVEQGFGDVFQFVRHVARRDDKLAGAKVIVECHPQLLRVLKGAEGIDQLVALGSHLPAFDVWAPLVSLPGIFGTTVETVPANVPYLRPDAELVEHWGRELQTSEDSGQVFKIGIAWQGNPTYRADKQRSIPLAKFAPLARVPEVKLISLQKGQGTDQLAGIAGQFSVVDLSDRLDVSTGAFMDTAAVMTNLDLVITSDTAVAHLAGALGIQVWLPLALIPDWRWLLEREDCPWYPTMRLFRQTRYGQWDEVFERMTKELNTILKE
jgi:tetratricopeptide (TPR) repeat protein